MTTSTTPASLTFVPWVRQGVTTAITAPDTNGASQPGVASIGVVLAVNGTPTPAVTVALRGPGDVIGIDRAQIVRTEPQSGARDFEPSFFPAVEFDRPDFPWLFTPARPGVAPTRPNALAALRPWLCLVVVRKQPGVSLGSSPDAPLPVLRIAAPAKPSVELPNLADSWAWAHAQVAAQAVAPDGGTAAVDAALAGSPDLSISRLICPRLLAADTEYVACVVPAFELGRKAGLGLPILDADLAALAPAWSSAATVALVTLPVYHSWEFRTSAAGSFTSLVAALRPTPAPPGLGRRPIDIDAPGFDTKGAAPLAEPLAVEGALRPLPPAGAVDAMPSWDAASAGPFQTALAELVNAPVVRALAAPNADPLLAPPLYGRWHASDPLATVGGTEWFDQLNLDPRLRGVAAVGTRVVQEHQEALMASAWAQAGDLAAANQRVRQLQMTLAVGDRLRVRHFAPLAPEASVRVGAPVLGRILGPSPIGVVSARVQLAQSGVPGQAVSAAMRRLGRRRGPLTRRVAAQGADRADGLTWVASLAAGTASLPGPPMFDLATISRLVQRTTPTPAVQSFAAVTDVPVAARPGAPWFVVAAEGQPVSLALSFAFGAATYDGATARAFRRAAVKHLRAVAPGRVGSSQPVAHAAFDITMVTGTLADQTRPERTVAELASAVVTTTTDAPMLLASTSVAPAVVDTLRVEPSFPEPMYGPLRDLSLDFLLPGLDGVAPNAVLGLETNRRFVEAYMVGLNFEMGRELLWRGYPTEQRGTYFDRFWGDRPDIDPLHRWGARPLGAPTTATTGRERFVLLFRSALLRRYPNAIVYLTRAVATAAGARAPSDAAADEVLPLFSGTVPPDLAFFGFPLAPDVVTGRDGTPGYYVVLQEHPTEPRFGVPDGFTLPNASHLAVGTTAPAGLPADPAAWGRSSASMAGILRHRPTRLAIHASLFLPPA